VSNKGLRYQSHNNGSRLRINYLTDGKWSKTLRNRKVHSDDDPDVAEDICGVYMDLCQQEAAQHSKLPPLWIGNNDIRGDEFEGERLKNVPHGMNRYKKHDVCCIFSALNPPQAHRKFLQDLCGMTEREVRRALLSQTAYQSCGRGILRDPDSTGVFLLIVPDRDTAEDIASYYPGCPVTWKSRRSGARPNTRRMWRGMQPKRSRIGSVSAVSEESPFIQGIHLT
jgi:hypothetical protein